VQRVEAWQHDIEGALRAVSGGLRGQRKRSEGQLGCLQREQLVEHRAAHGVVGR
jgi:hypothetical protein